MFVKCFILKALVKTLKKNLEKQSGLKLNNVLFVWLKVFVAYAAILSADILKAIDEKAKFRDCRTSKKRNGK